MKFILCFVCIAAVFTCEKPAPQKPKVIYSKTQMVQPKKDTISSRLKQDSLQRNSATIESINNQQ